MSKFVLLLIVLHLSAAQCSANMSWSEWKVKYGRSYSPSEEPLREAIFEANRKFVNEHNSSNSTLKLGLNSLADKELSEITSSEPKHPLANISRLSASDLRSLFPLLELPQELNWAKVPGRVSEVKDQSSCGSCWAFTTAGVVEGQLYRFPVEFTSLSAQYLLDCSGAGSCDGGSVDDALQFVLDNGIPADQDYPCSEPPAQHECKRDVEKVPINFSYIKKVPEDVENLKVALAVYGPIGVSINPSQCFQMHQHNVVFKEEQCLVRSEGHAMLLVGYGHDEREGDFWIIKNSWGKGWGEDGYVRYSQDCELTVRAIIV